MRFAAGNSSPPCTAAGTEMIRSTGSAGCCATAANPSPRASTHASKRGCRPVTRAGRSAWHCYQQLRSAYTAHDPAQGRRIAEAVISSFPTCPVPEIARLGRTLRSWKPQLLAYFTTKGVSNGGTEAVNLLIEKTRRLAHGFRNFTNYRLRILLVADATRPYRQRPTQA